jgi:hypothetical protein
MKITPLDRTLLLLTCLMAAYQVAVGINGLENVPIIAYTIAFGVLLVAGLLLIILGFEVLDSPIVVVVSTIIPLSLSMGLVWEHLALWRTLYLAFTICGFMAILLTRFLPTHSRCSRNGYISSAQYSFRQWHHPTGLRPHWAGRSVDRYRRFAVILFKSRQTDPPARHDLAHPSRVVAAHDRCLCGRVRIGLIYSNKSNIVFGIICFGGFQGVLHKILPSLCDFYHSITTSISAYY